MCNYFYFRAFTGKYNKTTEAGLYTCVVCNEKLFTSETKFDSGCGWPAFNDVIDQNKVKLTTDTSNGMLESFSNIFGFDSIFCVFVGGLETLRS